MPEAPLFGSQATLDAAEDGSDGDSTPSYDDFSAIGHADAVLMLARLKKVERAGYLIANEGRTLLIAVDFEPSEAEKATRKAIVRAQIEQMRMEIAIREAELADGT